MLAAAAVGVAAAAKGASVTNLFPPPRWTLELARAADGAPTALLGRTLPATVPGCVHTDLLALDLIPDPLIGRHEDEVQWIGACDWRYRSTVAVPEALLDEDRIDLHCEGLDTVATVEVNGRVVGRTVNMHRPHRFAVKDALRPGDNELVVTFASATAYAKAQAERLGDRPRAYPLPYNFVRKMACNFGWDWGPTLVTAGIWKPIRLDAWSCARIRELRPWVRLADRSTVPPERDAAPVDGVVELHLALERAGEARPVTVSARLERPDGTDVQALETLGSDAVEAVLRLEVPSVRRWWPRGYGEQPLYDLDVTLAEPGGRTLDARHLRIGFRSVALDTHPDEAGAAFTLVVNGRSVFAKGADWIPDDPFPSRLSEARLRTRLQQAADAGMNMLRVWGGGLYESDAFYRACDELGLLVWQDFAFACAAYPEEPPFDAEVEAEARANLTRLAPHPSLVLWNGNNENLWGFEDWGWQAALGDRSWGRHFYLELLPRLVAEVDPTRPYWPGSPWSGREDLHPNADGAGCKHIWDAWNESDYTVYRAYRPRFVAEFGHQAPPAYATLRRALPGEALAADSPGMLHHQKAVDGQLKLETRLAEHFPAAATFDAWHFATQLNQARALELGIRHFRSLAPHCMGTLVWQLNDCWPATSWSAVDVDGRLKPLWFALRRAYAARLLTLEPRGGAVTLFLHNDSDEPWYGDVRARRLRFDGTLLADATVTLAAAARGPAASAPLPEALTTPSDPGAELLVAEADGMRALHFFARDKELRYPEPGLEVHVDPAAPAARVTVRARTLVRDLTLLVDRLHPEATVDDALVTLLPGESHTFAVASPLPLRPEALAGPPVVTSANEIVLGARRR